MIHENRDWLATHAPAPLHGLYVALGVASPTAATLSSYQLRQWGVTGDPGASGTLRVRASILNASPQLQPYPLLRVALANRFGRASARAISSRRSTWASPSRACSRPERGPTRRCDIVDPGKDAEGFEIDVCLRNNELKISCAGMLRRSRVRPAECGPAECGPAEAMIARRRGLSAGVRV